jgi:ABC-type transport system substrate-binding protein
MVARTLARLPASDTAHNRPALPKAMPSVPGAIS